jgi:phosphoenolpyruvate-protein kinase (PTS system EI component)
MSEHELCGLAASPGVGIGRVLLLDAPSAVRDVHRGAVAEARAALDALDALAGELAERAERLRADGLGDEAEILEANGLMALDPILRDETVRLCETEPAASALRMAAGAQADVLASLDDPVLAARASDVRELGRRAARRLAPSTPSVATAEPSVVVADDIGPLDVAELRDSAVPIVGVVVARGAATSHAAIIARSLGLPMVVDAGEALLRAGGADEIVVDGDSGRAFLSPDVERRAWAQARMHELERQRRHFASERALPPVTLDGRWVVLLANAATAAEVRSALEVEADGVGLLRTELAFLEAHAWPTEEEHMLMLEPLLALLPGLTATVRVLDFGSDKTPPFLAGIETRGVRLLLDHEAALSAQLRAILRAAGESDLRILLPLVDSPEQVGAVRQLLREAAAATGRSAPLPPLGAMLETPLAVQRAHEIARAADFLSIGTNDLVQYTLGLDRTQPLATARSAGDPRVLRLVGDAVEAAHDAGRTIEICGEAASVPDLATLYVGLGVDELSVAPARVDELRSTVRSIDAAEAGRAAAAVLSGERRHETREVLGGRGGALA